MKESNATYLTYLSPSQDLIYRWKQRQTSKLANWEVLLSLVAVVPWDLATLGDDNIGLRLLRLFRLIQLFRFRPIDVQKWYRFLRKERGAERDIYSSFLELLLTFFAFLLLVHWSACLWRLLPRLEADQNDEFSDNTSWLGAADLNIDIGNFYLYTIAFHWAVSAILPNGSTIVAPVTSAEHMIASLLSIGGTAALIYYIGSFLRLILPSVMSDMQGPRLCGKTSLEDNSWFTSQI